MNCLLGRTPPDDKCKPEECELCGWNRTEDYYRKRDIRKNGLKEGADGVLRYQGRQTVKNLIGETDRCFLCGSRSNLERHHIFGGGYRKKSEEHGLVVTLCHFCHNEPPNGVHQNGARARELKAYAQKSAMEAFGWEVEDFIREFGKSYL